MMIMIVLMLLLFVLMPFYVNIIVANKHQTIIADVAVVTATAITAMMTTTTLFAVLNSTKSDKTVAKFVIGILL